MTLLIQASLQDLMNSKNVDRSTGRGERPVLIREYWSPGHTVST